jgi:hypothetical protein
MSTSAISYQPSAISRYRKGSQFKGFALVELLITTSLMALVVGAIVAVLSGGFRVWKRALEYGTHEQASLIAFEGMRRDFHNRRRFALVPFEGNYEEAGFAAVSHAEPHGHGPRQGVDPRPDTPREIGRLGYYLDGHRHLLCRSFVPYRLMRRVRLRDHCDVVLEDVQRVRFEYFGSPSGVDADESAWSTRWESPDPPLAVKTSLVIQEPGQPATTHTSIVYLAHPSGERP